ncbi:hypothetical protein HPB48_019837 [Haemaphysalis longicornis]|uniref:Caspase family p20 domain-containing protein n=1 Tax=Haemaphysalis longicornis TaxID=44386 RepID=A0A9J6FBA1_HAELO|nr:hypothetical protein HPB48_019837 [Haemaphysalis longicornis]
MFATRRPASQYPVLPTALEAEEYNMGHPNRGKCVIFNNRVRLPPAVHTPSPLHGYFEPHTKLSERRGTDLDAENLYLRFRELGFDSTVHHNMSSRQMLAELKSLGSQDYTHDDCFVCCILTHGDRDVLYATDGKFPVDSVMEPFRGDVCPTLLGKPKLFFVQVSSHGGGGNGAPLGAPGLSAGMQGGTFLYPLSYLVVGME